MSNPILNQAHEVIGICKQRGWTLGFAESCTGGLLSSWLTQIPGVSSVYQGSVVSYAGRVKARALGVSEASMAAYGEVSEPVAKKMAIGARQILECTWAVAITGIAGPTGGQPGKPVGTVCFAVSGPGFEKTLTHQFDSGLTRDEIQRRASVFAFDLLVSALR